MKIQLQQYLLVAIIVQLNTIFPVVCALNATVDIDYVKQGACNSSIIARVGDYCDYIVTITVAYYGSAATTDLSVEIIMPDNDTIVMQMSKPSISYVGENFQNPQNLYDPTITMSSQLNNSQYNDARIDFGTVVNGGLVAPSNTTQNSIIIGFRSVVISNPSYQINGSEYWVTVGVEYNNVSSIWIGQALFVYSNSTSATTGPFALGNVNNSTLQIPQGSPFALSIPIFFNRTYANNMIFTIINNNPSQIGLCSAYVQSATEGFKHLPTLGYEIFKSLTNALVSNQITINLGQIVNTQSYSSTSSILYIVVYGRVFKTDGISSFSAGSMTAQVTSSSPSVSQTYNIYATASVIPSALNGSLPTFSIEQLSSSVGIYQTLKLRITMSVPSGFSAPVVFDLNGSSNTSTPVLLACAVKFQSAGENVGSSNPQCTDPNANLNTYSSSINSTDYDQLTYDYGVIANLGSRSTNYADDVNEIVFDAVFQLLNTTQSVVWPTISMTLGNNTIWLANTAVNVVTISYNSSNATRPDFSLSYETNNTANQSITKLGYSRLFYYDIYTKPSGIYTPMTVRITTNETYPGSKIPEATICQVKIIDVGVNLPCFHKELYNQDQSPLITYSSRYNQRKNDTVYIQLGSLCNYETTQTDNNLGRIRIGVYVRVEPALGDGKSTYVNLDVYYSPSNLWIGQILFTGSQPGSTPTVVGTPLLFSLNSTQTFDRNVLTVINYGLKIPPNSYGTYTSLTSDILNDANSQTSVCRVDISPNRGRNVPCSNDVSSVFTYNSNGLSSTAVTDLGAICSIVSNSSLSLNSSLSTDSDTVIIEVFVLATTQSGSSFDLTLSNLIPSGQSALTSTTSHFTAGTTYTFSNISSLYPMNTTSYQQTNDTNNYTYAYLGQDLLIRTEFVLANNLTTKACYSLIFQFSITAATNDAAYFTNGFLISSGDNLMCMKSKALPSFNSGGSILYNSSMYLDFGIACYYPIDPTNTTASTLVVQSNVRVPVSTTVPLNSQLSVNIIALINNNQTNLSSSIPFTVQSQSAYTGFILFSNDTANVIVTVSNSTIQSVIRQIVTYTYRIYLPIYSQGRLQISLYSVQNSSSVTVNILSVKILSAGINVGSFMAEYLLGNKYQWTYSSSIPGSTYQDTAYLDLGVVTNTGTSTMLNNFSNTTDNFIDVQAMGYLTDSPAAEENISFDVILKATYGGVNISKSVKNVVSRNGTEQPIMDVNRTDLTSGPYGLGSTYKSQITFRHKNNSNAECINAQLIVYLPTWISLASYNSSINLSNYSTDSTSYILFNFGTILFNDVGTIEFTLNIGTSNQMALVFQRYGSPMITIPYEFLCMKRPRTNVDYFPTSKIFTFDDIVSLPVSITTTSSYPSLLDSLDSCQFTSSIHESSASLVRTSGWQTGYRSNKWMLSGATYLQINFGNLTLLKNINIEVPALFAPISIIQLGYSLDGSSFAIDPMKYLLNGSSTYSISLLKSSLIRSLRVYLIDVVQPSDLLTKTSGFILNVTGQTNSSDISVSSICSVVSNSLSPRTILVAPPYEVGLTYNDDVYVCDEVTTRTSILCHVLLNGDTTTSATWIALNTSVANIILFVYDPSEQLQFLYGYAQNGISIVRSNDRGLTWSVVDASEYSTVITQCNSGTKVCHSSESYSLMSGAPGSQTLRSGTVQWMAAIDGLWTQSSGGTLAFDWFGY